MRGTILSGEGKADALRRKIKTYKQKRQKTLVGASVATVSPQTALSVSIGMTESGGFPTNDLGHNDGL